MKKFFILPLAALLVACGGNKKANDASVEETPAPQVQQVQVEVQKSNPDIEDFYVALAPIISPYFESNPITKVSDDEEGTYTVDKKNGYLRHTVEGDGWYELQCCYWNRNDGSKLVALYEYSHSYSGEGDEMDSESSLKFYVFDKETRMLTNVEAPIEEELEDDCMICQLPREGKDIKYYYGEEYDEKAEWKTLKWNGMGFEKGE